MKIILYYGMAYTVTNKEYKQYLQDFVHNDGKFVAEIKSKKLHVAIDFTELTVIDATEYLKDI